MDGAQARERERGHITLFSLCGAERCNNGGGDFRVRTFLRGTGATTEKGRRRGACGLLSGFCPRRFAAHALPTLPPSVATAADSQWRALLRN